MKRSTVNPATAIETLESRRLLAAAIVDRTLFVNGTSGDDVLTVSFHDVETQGIRTSVNGVEQSFDVDDVDRIRVQGFGGDDGFASTDDAVVPTTLAGGDGKDEFGLVDPGGPLLVEGGTGDDLLEGPGSSTGFTFDGGSGRDGMELFDAQLIDLRPHPNVENAALDFGTIIGNGLGNRLEIRSAGTAQGLGGNDRLIGGTLGNDLFGGDGNDTLVGGDGADDLSGGSGLDTVDYSARMTNLGISIDGVANDGERGASGPPTEGDNVGLDVETVLAGSGNDWVFGNGLNNLFRGGAGNDFLGGFGGHDALYGDAGNDRLEGGNGNDYLEGGLGNDALLGEAGTDFFTAGDGDDWLYSRDGVSETVNGGPGFDRAHRDPSDNVLSIESFIA